VSVEEGKSWRSELVRRKLFLKCGAAPILTPAAQQMDLDGLKVLVWCDVRGRVRLPHVI